MRILNIIKIQDNTPQILEAFVFYDNITESVAQELITRAEYRFCKLLVGPGSEIEHMDKKVYQLAVMEGYNKGVIMMDPGYSLHLTWSEMKE